MEKIKECIKENKAIEYDPRANKDHKLFYCLHQDVCNDKRVIKSSAGDINLCERSPRLKRIAFNEAFLY